MSEDRLTYSLNELGNTIARYRLQVGLTQAQVAEKLGIGNDAVSRLERGMVDPPVGRLLALADVLDCSMAELLTESSPRLQDHVQYILHLLTCLETEEERSRALAIFSDIIKFQNRSMSAGDNFVPHKQGRPVKKQP